MVAMTSDTAHAPMLWPRAARSMQTSTTMSTTSIEPAAANGPCSSMFWRQPFTVEQLVESRGAGVLVEDLGGGLLAELKDQKVDIAH